MTDEQLPQEVTKHRVCRKVWDYLMKNELVNAPLNVYYRIPNFKGATEAVQRLAELEEFKKAKVIKISPDKSQEPVRFLALEANKEILVPIPRLRSGLFLHVTPVAGAPKNELRILSKMCGLQEAGKPLGFNSNIKIDLVVLGSVCVSRDGYRLGKGTGFADLEFAMMMRMGAVTQDTTVITTVHDCQVLDSLPPQLFKEYDVPVDIIITPTQTIIVNPRLKKPTGIIWHMLSERSVKRMKVLQQLKEMEEKEGKVIILKEEDSYVETQRPYKSRSNYVRNRRHFKTRKDVSSASDMNEEGETNNVANPRFPRRQYSKVQSEGDNLPFNQVQEMIENSNKTVQRRRKKPKHKSKSHIEFSLKLSNIPASAKMRDLRNVLSQRGIKPNEIVWRGHSGVCYLHFSKLRNNNSPEEPVQVDSIMSNLQELCIGESTGKENDFIIVKPAEPITRIEVTDVTSV